MRRICLTVGLTFCLGWLTLAPAATPKAEDIAGLIVRLGNDDFSQRLDATRALDELGADALPALKQAAQLDGDPEIRLRASELVKRIAHRLENARLLTPRRVRLVYKDTPVPQAIADFAEKAGRKDLLQLQGDTSAITRRTITLDTGDVSFWEAFDQFCRQAGLSERPAANQANEALKKQGVNGQVIIRESRYGGPQQAADNKLYLVDAPPSQLPTCNSGSVRVKVMSPAAPVPGLTKIPGETFVSLDVTPEQTLQWDGIIDVRIDKAIDDQGQALAQATSQTGAPVLGDEMMMWGNGIVMTDDGTFSMGPRGQVPVRLVRADRPAKALKELTGVVTVRVMQPEAIVTVEKLLQAAGQTVRGEDGNSIKVLDVAKRPGDRTAVRLQVITQQGGGFRGNRVVRVNGNNVIFIQGGASFTSASSRLAVVDAKGQPVAFTRSQRGLNANGNGIMEEELELTLPPLAAPGDLKLVLNGQRAHSLDVPFTLKDVPLP